MVSEEARESKYLLSLEFLGFMKELKTAGNTKTMPKYIPTSMGSMMNFLIDQTHHNEKQADIKNVGHEEKTPITKAQESTKKYENLFKTDSLA